MAALRRRRCADCSTAAAAAQALRVAGAKLGGHGAHRTGAPAARAASTCCPTCSPPAACSAGFFAIIAASQGKFEAACVAIFVAAVLDGIDGRVARMTNTQSEFGVQYDSLADLVSFGMAPALVMYHWALSSMKLDGAMFGKVGWLVAFLYAACAALRLARFNSQVGAGRQALVHRPGQSRPRRA